jgi:hypothetical protein
VTRVASVSRAVGFAPELTYTDTTYRLILHDRQCGLIRDVVELVDGDGRRIQEVPVSWQRTPFLSYVPSRVILHSHPVHVRLRCPDERVKLTRIRSTPQGVEARLESPREMTVALTDVAPGIVDGEIELETSARGQPPLRVHVVRYAPSVRR